VDDDESNAFILAKLLQHCGYEAVFELSGEAALKTAAAFEPDVVFMDLAMPDMSGYELARQLRQRGSDGKPRLVSLTGSDRGQGDGDDSVFDDYLLKPADVKTLCKIIDGGER
jgi:CheY-like chemotaxis protein